MTVVHKPFIIFEIELVKKAEIVVMGRSLHSRPELDMYCVKAVLKSYIEGTKKGYKLLEKLGHGDKSGDLTKEYLDQQRAFTVSIPMTGQCIEWNKYRLGSELMVAYYPSNVWDTFHTDDEPDNNNDKKRVMQDG